MNAISYITGEPEITDFPSCSARPLAMFVQWCNDLLADSDGYLSPEDSVIALELGWQTVGTADVPDTVIHAWVADLLVSFSWGVVRYATNAAIPAIYQIAELHRMLASGEAPPPDAWGVADLVCRAAAGPPRPTSRASGRHAARSAYHSTMLTGSAHSARLDAVTGNALRAHTLATGGDATAHVVQLTRHAIDSWRQLMRRHNPSDFKPAGCCTATRPRVPGDPVADHTATTDEPHGSHDAGVWCTDSTV